MYKVFLSHKQDKPEFTAQAEALARALDEAAPGAGIFRSEGIHAGDRWRDDLRLRLEAAKCLILLYTNPELDWSWCFYEVGAFMNKGSKSRNVYCLHPKIVNPPPPLANLQTIQAERQEIENWLKDVLCPLLKCRRNQTEEERKATAEAIEKLVNAAGPSIKLKEVPLKPYIWIELKWSGDWGAIPDEIFSDASVSVDLQSAAQLGYSDPPRALLPFLRHMACDNGRDRLEFWIKKFYESLQSAVQGKLSFEDAAYFRHDNGRIYRPVVVSYAKDASGTAKLHVIFAEAFVSPLTDSSGLVQLLSNGARLAVRTQLEVLDPFLGHTSQIHQEKAESTPPENEVSRKNPVGGRVVGALDAIWREALSHGTRPEEPAPTLFEGTAQSSYENIRDRVKQILDELKRVAPQEDETGTGEYPKTERLLAELKESNENYLALALPRIEELLVPEEKRRTEKTIGTS
jgi:hypothetical protein